MMHWFCAPFRSDFVMICDADVLFVRPIDDVLERVATAEGVGGSMAHVSPFVQPFSDVPEGSHAGWWRRIFEAYDLELPPLEHEHSGFGTLYDEPDARFSPAYFNSGVVIGTRSAMTRLAWHAFPATEAVRSVHNVVYCDQLALSLMMYAAQVPILVLPVRFNCPNDPVMEKHLPDDYRDIRILHYLRQDVVDRRTAFVSQDSLRSLLGRTDLAGVNELLRTRLAEILAPIAFTSS